MLDMMENMAYLFVIEFSIAFVYFVAMPLSWLMQQNSEIEAVEKWREKIKIK